MLSLSLLHLLLLLYLALSFTDAGTAALYPSFSPPSFLLRLGSDFLSKEAASLFHVTRWIDGDTPAAALPANTRSVSLCFSLSPSLSVSLSQSCCRALSALILLLTAQPSLTDLAH